MATGNDKTDVKKAGSEKSADQKKQINEGPEPNLAYVGEEGYELTKIQNGRESYKLPEDQSKPFYHKNAAQIVQLFGDMYKIVKKKGE